MYEAYYGFEEKPFTLSPDPKYLFLSATHREVLGHLLYGIEQGEGFMAISGEVGTGKTTLCRTLLDRLGASCEIAFLFNPTLTPTDLIKAINAEFDLSTFGDSRPELLDVLNTFLLEKNADGRRVLVIIDEAQNLPNDTLEQLRLLSNLESRTAKLLQIVLIGQPELDEKLEAKELRQLRQRITVWWRLGPLTASETRAYVRHRLRVASGADRPIFSEAALTAVHRLTGGVPRLVNVLCDRALLAGYGEQMGSIAPRVIRDVAKEIRIPHQPRRLPWWLGLGAAGAGAIALALGLSGLPSRLPPAAGASPPAVALPPPRIDPGTVPVEHSPAPQLSGDWLDSLPPQLSGDWLDSLPPQLSGDWLDSLAPQLSGDWLDSPAPQLSDDVLDSLMTLEPSEISNGLALAAMLEAWREPPGAPEALSFPQLLAQLEGRGLQVLRVRSPLELTRLDLPGLVRLRGPDGGLRTSLLRHVENDNAQLAGFLDGELVRVSMATLASRWGGSGYVVWRNFEGFSPVLRDGGAGPGVSFLQRALTRLGHYHDEIHGSFDAATLHGVMSFQASVGLPVDGECGPQTQIRLYHALPEYRMPALALSTATSTALLP